MKFLPYSQDSQFGLGRIVGKPNALRRIPLNEIFQSHPHHFIGDCGEYTKEICRANDLAIAADGGLFAIHLTARLARQQS
ncbi:MAG: hypothetical protein CMJ47_02785 [Planctomyces sp.]|nr:hypothetical protein [Planctomyces sp.]